MVEEQVEVEVLAAHLQMHLAADEREAGAQLEQQLAQVLQEAAMEIAFAGVFGQAEKVEVVGVFEEG